MTISLSLLAVDLANAAPGVREALTLNDEEIETFLVGLRSKLAEPELVLLSSRERFEVYATEDSARPVFRQVLRELVARAGGHESFGTLRSVDARGVAVARHLFEIATRSAGAPEFDLGDLTLAVARSHGAGALGAELSALFTSALGAGRRAYRETAMGDATSSRAERDVAALEIERILEEELVAWKATRRGPATSVPPAPDDSSYRDPHESGTAIRANVPGLASSHVA